MLKIEQPRMAHIVDGRLYLAAPTRDDPEQYRRELRAAYGTLRGIKLVLVKTGTCLTEYVNSYMVPFQDEMEPLP